MVLVAYAEPESPVVALRNTVFYLPSGVHSFVNKHSSPKPKQCPGLFHHIHTLISKQRAYGSFRKFI